MKCLVTGGCGFIGSHLVDLLLKEGFHVVAVDDLSTGKINNLQGNNPFSNPNLECRRTDFADFTFLQEIRRGTFDWVFHLAAMASVPYSVEHPVDTNNNNVSKTLALLEACRVGKVKKFVFSSSSAVYGDSKKVPTPESEPRNPESPYALQKAMVEDYCKLYSKLYGFQSICLRYFNVFGPRQAGSGPYANVISSWCVNGIRNKRIRLDGDGSAQRDFVYVGDVARANLLAAKSEIEFGCYNVGSGNPYSIKHILGIFLREFGDIDIDRAPQRLGDVSYTEASTYLASEKIKHMPSARFFEDDLVDTFNWYKENVK